MGYNKKLALTNNINALEIAFRLEKEKRKATAEELNALKKFTGFGGLKCILYETRDESDLQRMPNSEKEMFPLVQQLNAVILQNSSTPQEYAGYVASLRSSVLTAFYTPTFIPEAIGTAIKKAGVNIHTSLDPSAGIGVFGQCLQKSWPDMAMDCFEKDSLTAKILSATNPDYKVKATGFEKIGTTKMGKYDLVTSNIPFGNFKIYDPSFLKSHDKAKLHSLQIIHEYFFLKGIESLRPGGILAFVTSKGIMDSPSNRLSRESMMNQCRLLSAVRFPDNIFEESSGIKVPSDLIMLQKRLPDTVYDLSAEECNFIESTLNDEKINLNSFFHYNQENILAEEIKIGTNQFGKPDYIYSFNGELNLLEQQLSDRISNDILQNFSLADYKVWIEKKQEIPEIKKKIPVQPTDTGLFSLFDIWDAQEIEEQTKIDEWAPYKMQTPIQSWYLDGMLAMDEGQLGIITKLKEEPVFTPIEVSQSQKNLLTDYLEVRNSYADLYYSELNTKREQPDLRSKFNHVYDKFREKHGALNEKKVQKIIMKDAFQYAVQGVELYKDKEYVKGTLFFEPVAFEKEREVPHDLSATDALLESYNQYGGVNLPYISLVSGIQEDELIETLQNRISYNPVTRDWEPYEKFVSCDVYATLDRCEKYLNMADEEEPEKKWIFRSMEQLKAVTPKPKTFADIDINLGERWIPMKYYEDYASSIFLTDIKVGYLGATDKFGVKLIGESTMQIRDQWCIRGNNKNYNGLALYCFALEDRYPDVNRRVYNRETQSYENKIDAEKTQLMLSKVTTLREGFVEWMQQRSLEEKKSLMDLYNRKFNCYAKPKYDGSHLTFPGLHLENLGIEALYHSQKDAVWMNLMNVGAVVDHPVGGGKTLTICLTAHEMKRMNLRKKPLVIGLKANIGEIYEKYRLAYPDDKALFVPGNLSVDERVRVFQSIKNNDWDAIFMSHENYGKIPQSLSIQYEIINAEIDELIATKTNGLDMMSKRDSKALQKLIENKKVQSQNMLDAINSHKAKGAAIPDFEEMGIGHLFVDESHMFKNLGYGFTKHSRVSGLGDAVGSQRAKNLLLGIRTIQQRNGRDLGASFFSGTTILNSLIEIYSLLYYLTPSILKQQNINCMDAFLAIYAQKTSEFEVSVTNDIINKERFRYFVKTDALAQIYTQITDFRIPEDTGMKQPKLVEELIICKMTPEQEEFAEILKEFARTGNYELVLPYVNSTNEKARMLIATDLARKMAIDMRMLDPVNFHDHPNNKISCIAQHVAADYFKYNDQKGTQFIFTDYGAYKGDGSFTPVEALKEKLVNQYGIPEHEIQFIQEYQSDVEKKLFSEKMNEGLIRIGIGGTSNLGTGINAQVKSVAVNNLDHPYRPGDLVQRHARAGRPGNIVARDYCNNQVKVRHYCTERTLDAYKFNLLQLKQAFIHQFKSCNMNVTRFDEGALDENSGLQFGEYCAILSGNTDLIENIKNDKMINSLESERKAFYNDLDYSKYDYETLQKELESNTKTLERISLDLKAITPEMQERLNALHYFNSLDSSFKEKTMVRLNKYPGISSSEKIGEHIHMLNKELIKKNQTAQIDFASIGQFNIQIEAYRGMMDAVGTSLLVHGPGRIFYKHNYGSIPFDHVLTALSPERALLTIPRIKREYEDKIERATKKISELAVSIQRKWGKEDKLAELKERKIVLEKKISENAQGSNKALENMEDINLMDEEQRAIYEQQKQAKSDMTMLGLSDDIIKNVLEGEDVLLQNYTILNPYIEDTEIRCSNIKISFQESGILLDGKSLSDFFDLNAEHKKSVSFHR